MGQLNAGIVPVTPFQQNCTILFDMDDKTGVVVDPGGDVDQILAAAPRQRHKGYGDLLTHGHIDHAGGAMELKEALGVEIIGPHEADKLLLDNIENQAKRFGVGDAVRNCAPDRFLNEGETVSFGEHVFEVLHCPGHAPGHVVYYNRAAQFAHVGDVLFRGSIGRTDLAGRRPCRAHPLDQGEASAARRRDRLHLRPRAGRALRRGAPQQSVSRLTQVRSAVSKAARSGSDRAALLLFAGRSVCHAEMLRAVVAHKVCRNEG